MVNKTQFYKTKVALAVVVSLGLAACGGGDDSTATSNSNTTSDATQNTVDNQTELSGTVQGVVVDTNGNPLEGVMVYLGADETVTNAGGQYVFTNVGVTNVNGVNNEGDESDDDVTQTLVVTIAGTDAFLGALVTVTPEAQVNNTGGQGSAGGAGGDVAGTDNDNEDATGGAGGAGTNGDNSQVTIQTFVDGFTAQAGTAVLPTLNAGAYGYIRDCRTGAQLLDTADLLSLDFVSASGNDVSTAISGNGTQLTNAEDTHTIGSDAEGMFSLTNLAANSSYTITPKQGWVITSGDASFNTNSEGSSHFLNTIEVCPVKFVSGPNVTPFVTGVAGVTEISAPDKAYGGTTDTSALQDNKVYTAIGNIDQRYGLLTAGVNKEFTVSLSEALDTTTFQAADVEVIAYSEATGNSYVATDSVTLSADGKTLTVIATEALDAGTKFSILIPRFNSVDETGLILDVFGDDYNGALDEKGNVRTAGVTDPRDETAGTIAGDLGAETVGTVTYDYFFEGTSKATYVKLNLCIFNPVSTGGDGSAAQIIDDEAGIDGDSTILANYSDAYQDAQEVIGESEVQQVNGQGSLTALRLEKLAVANGIAVDVSSTESRLAVTFAGASAASVVADSTTVPASVFGQSVVGSYDGTAASVLPLTTGYVDLTGVARGERAVVNFADGFGVSVATSVVTLNDAIAPTTVVQDDYDLHGYTNASGYAVTTTATGELNYGNGGEVSNDGVADQPGNPIVWIQPRHLAAKGTGNTQPVRGSEFVFLQDDKTSRLDATAGDTQATAPNTTLSTYQTTHVIYDAQSWAAVTAMSQEIGVAFSEDVAFPTASAPLSGAGTLTGWVANNNVARDVDGNLNVVGANIVGGVDTDADGIIDTTTTEVVASDLVQFTTADILGLANNNPITALNIIDFTSAIQDTYATPNVAGANTEAKVVVADAMPAFVTNAHWDGSTFVIEFNEAVKVPTLANSINITVENPDTTATASTTIAVNDTKAVLTNAGKTMTITLTVAEQGAVSPLFIDGLGNEFLYADTAEGDASDEEQHAVLIWDAIQDATTTISGTGAGNSWATFASVDATIVGNDREEVFAPRFLAYNNVGPFVNTGYVFSDLAGGAGTFDDDGFTVEISFSHPVSLTADVDADAGTVSITDLADQGDAGTTFFDSIAEIRAMFAIDIDGDNVYDAGAEDGSATLPAGTTASLVSNSSGTKITLSIPATGAPGITVGTSRIVMIDGALVNGVDDGDSLAVNAGHGLELTSATVPGGVKLPVAGSIQ